MKSQKILILSIDTVEISTEKVMDWIIHLRHTPIRINSETIDISDANEISLLKGKKLILGNIPLNSTLKSIWFRRWGSDENTLKFTETCNKHKLDQELIIKLLGIKQSNLNSYKDFILKTIKCDKILTTENQVSVNKLAVLCQAKNLGFNVPKFIITNRKSNLESFIKKLQKPIVIKDLEANFLHFYKNKSYLSYTEILTEADLKIMKLKFPMSFFQEFIKKEIDIRAFFINGKIFSMAIFSQKNKQTEVDFRKFDLDKPNRTVPYKLPNRLENKIIKLMANLKLITGSIDLLKDSFGKYYFLEVNPVGQFDDVSTVCNYNLEFEIAKYLTE